MIQKRPNIIWLISDDTNHEMLGYLGAKVLTPTIDSIAKSGVVFTNYHTVSSACTPSRYSYITGLYPGHCRDPKFQKSFPNGESYNIAFNTDLTAETPNLASILKASGYHTGFVGKCHTGSSRQGLNGHSYNENDDPCDPEVSRKLKEDYASMQKELRSEGFDYADGISWGNTDGRPIKKLQFHNLEWHTDHAFKFLATCQNAKQPFFLNFATTTIHGPQHMHSVDGSGLETEWGYLTEAPKVQAPRETIYSRLKAAGIELTHRTVGALWMDDTFKAVLDKATELGLMENTIVIYSTDHGVGVTSGKFTCYQGGVKIPHVMKWDGHISAGSTYDGLAENVDFLPTILDMAGVALPNNTTFDGKSIWSHLLGQPDDRDDLFFEWGYTRAVRTRKWKYIAYRPTQRGLEQMKSGAVDRALDYGGLPESDWPLHHYPCYYDPDQLFDLENDPTEQKNLAADPKYATILADMKQRLKKYLARFDRPFDVDTVDPFLYSDTYRKLCEVAVADKSIYQREYYIQKGY